MVVVVGLSTVVGTWRWQVIIIIIPAKFFKKNE